jgi:4-hydroxybenzoate polyprenyltransferase
VSRLSRILRPRHPLFWLLVALQALSTVFVNVLVRYEPAAGLAFLLSGLVVANSAASALILWRLVRDDA